MTGPAKPGAENIMLRAARPADLPAIHAIYTHHVRHGLASFEIEPPDLEEQTARYERLTAQCLPYLAAELEGRVCGYANAGPYRPRPA